ncbi:MAG: hypothetical protein JO236_05730 [Mycobacterium sp.]|uniref:hypothetical protein n=1 Tax=Mycobacterium sp. TaxID=1785 RepID=UPI001ED4364D|nr:hypothetical protein [Mycobacterium sp.]MBW0017034.1 hypothetical protein [Mycobacterium sp.]
MAVNATGTVYVVERDNKDRQVVKLTVGSTTPTMLPFTGLNQPDSVAVDTAGSIYVTESHTVLKLPAA